MVKMSSVLFLLTQTFYGRRTNVEESPERAW